MSESGNDLYVLGAIGVLVLCSLLTRGGYPLVGNWLPLKESVRRTLRYAPAAALVGIIVPELLPWQVGTAWPQVDLKFFAALAGVLIYSRTHNGLWLIVGGMVAYWVLALLMWLIMR